MIYVFYGLFILACIILVIAVLLQPGKADAGALFSGGVNSTAFGARGTATLLQKITIGAAASFFLIALLVSQPAFTGERSLLQSTPDTGPAPTPVPTPAPAAPTAPTPGASTAPAQPNPAAAGVDTPAAASETKSQPAATPAPKAPAKKGGK